MQSPTRPLWGTDCSLAAGHLKLARARVPGNVSPFSSVAPARPRGSSDARGESLTVVAIKKMDGVLSCGTLKAVLSARARLSSDWS